MSGGPPRGCPNGWTTYAGACLDELRALGLQRGLLRAQLRQVAVEARRDLAEAPLPALQAGPGGLLRLQRRLQRLQLPRLPRLLHPARRKSPDPVLRACKGLSGSLQRFTDVTAVGYLLPEGWTFMSILEQVHPAGQAFHSACREAFGMHLAPPHRCACSSAANSSSSARPPWSSSPSAAFPPAPSAASGLGHGKGLPANGGRRRRVVQAAAAAGPERGARAARAGQRRPARGHHERARATLHLQTNAEPRALIIACRPFSFSQGAFVILMP